MHLRRRFFAVKRNLEHWHCQFGKPVGDHIVVPVCQSLASRWPVADQSLTMSDKLPSSMNLINWRDDKTHSLISNLQRLIRVLYYKLCTTSL